MSSLKLHTRQGSGFSLRVTSKKGMEIRSKGDGPTLLPLDVLRRVASTPLKRRKKGQTAQSEIHIRMIGMHETRCAHSSWILLPTATTAQTFHFHRRRATTKHHDTRHVHQHLARLCSRPYPWVATPGQSRSTQPYRPAMARRGKLSWVQFSRPFRYGVVSCHSRNDNVSL